MYNTEALFFNCPFLVVWSCWVLILARTLRFNLAVLIPPLPVVCFEAKMLLAQIGHLRLPWASVPVQSPEGYARRVLASNVEVQRNECAEI